MITKKEFYFVRHGQTDGNAAAVKQDHGDISLNATGRQQARMIGPIVASLPVKTICYSPLKRAKETRDIACSSLNATHAEVINLSECNTQIWLEMTALGKDAKNATHEPVYSFMQRVVKGINEALACHGPVLIVAHGGIHWATCCFMEIDQHDWIIDNCIVTHFTVKEEGRWTARKLNALGLFNE